MWNSTVAAAERSVGYLWFWLLLTIALRGIVPLLFGLYLMVSGRLLINLCYPDPSSPEQAHKSGPSREEEGKLDRVLQKREDAKNDDRKYMPPEMRG